jgi:hypothetical protein
LFSFLIQLPEPEWRPVFTDLRVTDVEESTSNSIHYILCFFTGFNTICWYE